MKLLVQKYIVCQNFQSIVTQILKKLPSWVVATVQCNLEIFAGNTTRSNQYISFKKKVAEFMIAWRREQMDRFKYLVCV
jgi:hypothetical protein